MKEYITKKLIEDGLMSNVIKPVLENDGLKAYIGEHWFYFGGVENEQTEPKDIPTYLLIELIKDALDGFYEASDEFETEYLYYYYYLLEHI